MRQKRKKEEKSRIKKIKISFFYVLSVRICGEPRNKRDIRGASQSVEIKTILVEETSICIENFT